MALTRGRTFGFSVSTPPDPTDPAVALTGAIDRQAAMPSSHAAFLGGAVLKLQWDTLQPTGPTQALQIGLTVADGGLLAITDFKASFPTTPYKVRMYAGVNAPAWVRATSGVGTWQFIDPQELTNPDGSPKYQYCPRWWRTPYMPLYRQIMEKLRDYLADDPYCREIQNSACATIFAEPMQRQMNANYTDTAFAQEYEASRAGTGSPADGGVPWTHQRDIASLVASVDTMSEVFYDRQRWAVALSLTALQDLQYNTNGTVKYKAGGVLPRITTDWLGASKPVADHHVATFGLSGTLMNNGFSTDTSTPEATIWDYMKVQHDTIGQPIAFQTETMAKLDAEGVALYDVMGSTSSGLRGALYYGAMFCEMPSGYQTRLTTGQLTTLNGLFAANAP